MALESKVGLASGLLWAAVLALRVDPNLCWLDGGELVASAFQLGVPHPTGFPAVMLGAKLATAAPLGSIAFRTALLSALSAAAALGLVAALATRLCLAAGAGRLAAGLGGAVASVGLGCAPTMLLAATGLEIYAPSLAILAAMLVVALPASRRFTGRRAAALGLLYGLGATTHAIVRFEGLVPLAFALALARDGSRLRLALVTLGAAIVGALSTLYIPLASLRDPPLDWGDPETIARLFDHLTGGRIRRAYSGRMLNPAWLGLDAAALARLVVGDLGLPACALACLGLGGLARAHRRAAALLAAIAVTDIAYTVLLNPMGIADRQVGMPTLAVLSLLAGAGVAAVAGAGSRWRLTVAAAATAWVAVPAAAGAARWAGSGYGPSSMIFEALALPARSAVLCSSDNLCAGMLWAQYVEGDRPDVLALPRQHLWDRATLEARLRRHAPELLDASGPGLDLRRGLALLLPARPVFWERGGDTQELRALGAPVALSLAAPPPLQRLGPAPSAPPPLEAAAALRAALRRWSGAERPRDEVGRSVAAAAFGALATAAAEQGDDAAARRLLEDSLAVEPTASTLLNLSALEVRRGRPAEAWPWIARALETEPGSVRALTAAGRLRLSQGDDAAARPYFERAARLCPASCGAPLEGLGILAARAGRHGEARRLLEEALRREPALEDARLNLELLDRVAPRGILTP